MKKLAQSQIKPVLIDWRNETSYRLEYDSTLTEKEKGILKSILGHLDKLDEICKKRGKY